jgi:hypothetical protein
MPHYKDKSFDAVSAVRTIHFGKHWEHFTQFGWKGRPYSAERAGALNWYVACFNPTGLYTVASNGVEKQRISSNSWKKRGLLHLKVCLKKATNHQNMTRQAGHRAALYLCSI